MVKVHVFDKQAQLVGPVDSPKLVLSDEEWKRRLTPEQFQVLSRRGDRAAILRHTAGQQEQGVYACAGCGLPLFSSDAKFHSGTGWPSFFQPIAPENIAERSRPQPRHGPRRDLLRPVRRTLGPRVRRRPAPDGLAVLPELRIARIHAQRQTCRAGRSGCRGRECWNGRSRFKPDRISSLRQDRDGRVCRRVFLVYRGGLRATDRSERRGKRLCRRCAGDGQLRVACARATPGMPRRSASLTIPARSASTSCWTSSSTPTTRRSSTGKGPTWARSTARRSSTPTSNSDRPAEAKIEQLNQAKAFGRPIVTTLEPLVEFYPAEQYHQDYARNHLDQPYIQMHALDKVCKIRSKHADVIERG